MKYLPLLLALSLPGCATYKIGPADLGQALDSTTTAIALYGTNAIESNGIISGIASEPAGMAAIILAKIGITIFGKSLPEDQCRPVSGILFGLGTAAGINNLLVIAGVTTAPAAVIPGTFLLWYLYDHFDLWKIDCIKPNVKIPLKPVVYKENTIESPFDFH